MEIKKILDNKAEYCSLEYIINNFDNLDITTISINPINKEWDNNGVTIIQEQTNLENPICIKQGKLYINNEYYTNNKKDIDLSLAKILYKAKNSITLNGTNLITDNILNVLAINEKLSEIELINTDGNKYSLSSDVYNFFKDNNHIKKIKTDLVDEDIKDIFVPLIDNNYNRRLFDFKRYEDLTKEKLLFIYDSTFNNNTTDYLYLINENCKIDIEANSNEKLDYNIKTILDNTKCKNIDIHIIDKIYFNNNTINMLKNYNTDSINVYVDGEKYNLNQYLEYEKRLNELVEPAMNLSPLERYLYAYNIVKVFKPYNEVSEKNWTTYKESRNVYKLLDNEYMVCVGYSNLLVDLLARLGIQARDIGVQDYTDFDSIINDYDKDIVDNIEHSYRFGGHARVEVKIIDSKYNVDGIYIADPTWNNDYDYDNYTFALMTKEEHNSMFRENGMAGFYDDKALSTLLEGKTIEEYYEFVNYYLNRRGKERHNEENNKDYTDNFMYKSFLEKVEKSEFSLENIKETIKNIIKKNYLGDIYNNENFINRVIASQGYDYQFDRIKTQEELDKYEEKIVLNTYKEYLNFDYKKEEKEIVNYLMKYIKKFNPILYETIINKYPIVIENANQLNEEQFSDIIENIGYYIIKTNNNTIKGSTILEAVKVVYKANGLNDEEIEKKIIETQKDNEHASDILFPKRRKIYADNSEEIFMNPENKFSEDGKTR